MGDAAMGMAIFQHRIEPLTATDPKLTRDN
jgi:hypothetical protein